MVGGIRAAPTERLRGSPDAGQRPGPRPEMLEEVAGLFKQHLKLSVSSVDNTGMRYVEPRHGKNW